MASLDKRGDHRVDTRLLPGSFWPLVVLFGLSMTSNLLMLAGPLYMLQIYDRVLTSKSVPTLLVLFGLVSVMYITYAAIEALRSRMLIRYAGLVETTLGPKLFRVSVRLGMISPNASQMDPLRDLDTVRQFLSGAGPLALFDLPWIPLYLGIVFVFHPLLGWLALAGALTLIVLMIANEFYSRMPARRASDAAAQRQRQSDTARTNAEAISAMGMAAPLSDRWMASANTLSAANQIGSDRSSFFASLTKALRYLLQSAMLTMGAYLAIEGQISPGLLIASSIISSRALAPIEQVVASWKGFVAARQASARLKHLLSATHQTQPQTVLPSPTQSLTVQNLASGPYSDRAPVIGGFNFQLRAGEGLGILGMSGSGKSTLGRALVGVWPALRGEISLDGSALQQYGEGALGAAIGYLPQRVELFGGTIAQNIARFSPDASDKDIIAAAKLARVHAMIAAMPDGYDTILGELGGGLSAGQAQRIGLARALYGNPFLIVLDEPNSNLDGEGDAALKEAVVHARSRGAIVIVIAHRASAIASVDKLLFIQNGRQTYYGAKNEVLRQISGRPEQAPQLAEAERKIQAYG